MKKLTLIIISLTILVSCAGHSAEKGAKEKSSDNAHYITKSISKGNKSKDGLVMLQYASIGGLSNDNYIFSANTINGETTYQIISTTTRKILKEKKSNDSAITKLIKDFEDYIPELIVNNVKLSDIGIDGPEVSIALINNEQTIKYENFESSKNQFKKLNEISNRFRNHVALTLFEPKYYNNTLSIKTEIGSKIEIYVINQNMNVVRTIEDDSKSKETKIDIGAIDANQKLIIRIDKIPIYLMN